VYQHFIEALRDQPHQATTSNSVNILGIGFPMYDGVYMWVGYKLDICYF